MRLTLAYSPCPNDTYAFHAMVHNLVDCEGLTFEPLLADIAELNSYAAQGRYQICKMSYHAYFLMADRYRISRSGSALGFGNGPLLVAKKGSKLFNSNREVDLEQLYSNSVATPGSTTTAALLLKILFPKIERVKPMLFSSIEEAILSGEQLSGVLIHERRFTYRERGLELIADLGELWEERNSLPLPLGLVAISRELEREVALKVERVLKRSIEFANQNPTLSSSYITANAQEMEQRVLESHIKMFVNNHTLELGELGERAVLKLYQESKRIYPKLSTIETLFI